MKRQAEGLTDEVGDDPLPAHVVADLDARFKASYEWELGTRGKGADSVVGRI